MPPTAITISITIAYSPAPRQLRLHEAEVTAGATIGSLLPLLSSLLGIDAAALLRDQSLGLGVWGVRSPLETVLEPGDRLECYRALRVDPKVARRERFSRQGARAAGLFAKPRAGAKAGY